MIMCSVTIEIANLIISNSQFHSQVSLIPGRVSWFKFNLVQEMWGLAGLIKIAFKLVEEVP